jgi:acyl-CoA dehydrogenase
MNDDYLAEPFQKMLDVAATPETSREAERTGQIEHVWSVISESGFLDALSLESAGGFALELTALVSLFEAVGRSAAPAPIAQTMAARALLALAGMPVPSGPIVLAESFAGVARRVPFARVSDWALVDDGECVSLVDLAACKKQQHHAPRSLAADVQVGGGELVRSCEAGKIMALAAALQAADIAGAADRVLVMSVAYANERSQFGKPIGRQQAVQQQLALMAEKVVMARMAAKIGLNCALLPGDGQAATAKAVASAAAAEIVAIAHAVFGAIGISEEHDLQLYTRRMAEARQSYGAESFWYQKLGNLRLSNSDSSSVDFIRAL